jgi:eukaryotic-like serine/threonine-protein kinase
VNPEIRADPSTATADGSATQAFAPPGQAPPRPTQASPVTGSASGPVPSRLLPQAVGDGRYRITGQLGVGGMGVVVRACDDVLGRDVAVKLLADNLALDGGSRARFLHEGRAAAAITDPRVVAIYDVGDEDGRPYLVMECVDGPSLAEVLATDGPLGADEVERVAVDALGALNRAHEAGLLHRDVKPGNFLRAPDGTTKVTDFGVAVAVDGERLTRTGFVIGTAGYLAPERRRGEPATVRTDLWALGATLTELLTGASPGDEATERLADHEGLSPRLRELLRRLLADHPDDRPDDALAALALLADDPARSGAPTPPPVNAATSVLPAVPASPTHRSSDPLGAPIGGDRAHRPVGDTGPSTDPGPATDEGPAVRGDRRRAIVTGALATLAVVGIVTVGVVGSSGPEGVDAEPEFGTVVIDPGDPAGTARELADRIRQHAAGTD